MNKKYERNVYFLSYIDVKSCFLLVFGRNEIVFCRKILSISEVRKRLNILKLYVIQKKNSTNTFTLQKDVFIKMRAFMLNLP